MRRFKERFMKNAPHSAIGCYEAQDYVSAWQSSDIIKEEDIFKQLRVNLNKYEKQYNQSKKTETRSVKHSLHLPKLTIEEKQNETKIPAIVYSTPLKRITTTKQVFTIRNRNILQDALNYSDQPPPKLFKISKLFKMRRDMICQQVQSASKSQMGNRRSKTKKSGIQKSLVDYDFSDSRLHPYSYAKREQRSQENE